jgi:mRNA-degrading endonuclease RelE of RelBE toxin-antitoxin system
MTRDPELQDMSAVYDALQNLDENTRKRVVDWVLLKLKTVPDARKGVKRGTKPGSQRKGKRGRPFGSKNKIIA